MGWYVGLLQAGIVCHRVVEGAEGEGAEVEHGEGEGEETECGEVAMWLITTWQKKVQSRNRTLNLLSKMCKLTQYTISVTSSSLCRAT
jgi:hypothetical protein